MARFIAGKLLPWRRYWVRWDGSVNSGYDGRGFVDDPEDEYGALMNPAVRPIDDLLSLPCLVLGGQPGIGKSTEIDRLQARRSEWLRPDESLIIAGCLDIDSTSALLRDTVESRAWRETLESGRRIRLLMDGVDQALTRVPTLVRTLVSRLGEQPLDRVSVIMACRVWDWDTTGDTELFALWPQAGEHRYELCHLRRKDAELAARESCVDPDAFLEGVYRIRAQGLAARPITLRMLLEEMRQNGRLPSDHRTVFGRAIRRLAGEWDPERVRYQPTRPPPAAHVERTAARISGLLILSGKNTIIRGADAPSAAELPLADIVGGTETADGCTFPVSEDLVEATLATPLFSSRGKDRFGFDHASYPEHLCASYLAACTLPQVRKLLCVRVARLERVAPQLGEVAANLANIHPAWCDHLIEHEPEVLLRSDASGLDPDRKARLVASLLSRAADFKAFEGRHASLFYHSLAHPGLASQLRPYITDPSNNSLVRRMAIGIAGEADVLELEADLWARAEANDERLDPIAHTLGKLAGPQSRERLLQAARGELPDNEGGDLKGVSIQKLVPSMMPVRDILPHIRTKPSRSFIGAYSLALQSHLPRAMTIQDVPAVADFVESETGVFDRRMHLNPLVARAFELGLPGLDEPAIARSLARLWLKMARGHRPFPQKSSRSDRDPLAALDDPLVRRRLCGTVLGLPDVTPNDLLDHRVPLLRDEDLGWLLDELPQVPPADRQRWAKACAALCWGKARPTHRDLILRRCGEIPELREALPAPGRHDTVTTIDRLRRAGEIRWSRRNARFAAEMARPTRTELLDGARAALAEGSDTAWVGFCECAYEEDPRDPDQAGAQPADHADIESSPAWLSLADEERQHFRASARLFLLSHDDRDRPADRWSYFSAAAYHAIRLLRDDLDADRVFFAEAFDRWPMVVFDHPGSGGTVEREQVALACRHAPGSARAWISRDLERSHRKEDSGIHWSLLADCWDASLSEAVVAFLKTHPVRSGLFVNAVGFLSQHDRVAALGLLDALLERRGGSFEPVDELGRGLVAIALFRFPQRFLARLWHLLEKVLRAAVPS